MVGLHEREVKCVEDVLKLIEIGNSCRYFYFLLFSLSAVGNNRFSFFDTPFLPKYDFPGRQMIVKPGHFQVWREKICFSPIVAFESDAMAIFLYVKCSFQLNILVIP